MPGTEDEAGSLDLKKSRRSTSHHTEVSHRESVHGSSLLRQVILWNREFNRLTNGVCARGPDRVDSTGLAKWQRAHQVTPTGKMRRETIERARELVNGRAGSSAPQSEHPTAAERDPSKSIDLTSELLVVSVFADRLRPMCESDFNLKAQHEFLRSHIAYVMKLLCEATSTPSATTLRAAEVGVALARTGVALMVEELEGRATGQGRVVQKGVNRGLEWVWSGMRELRANSDWPVKNPRAVDETLKAAEFHELSIEDLSATAKFIHAGQTAASVASIPLTVGQLATEGAAALSRLVVWLGEGGGGGAALQLVMASGPELRLVANGKALVLTAVEAAALAKGGVLSWETLQLFMAGQKGWRGDQDWGTWDADEKNYGRDRKDQNKPGKHGRFKGAEAKAAENDEAQRVVEKLELSEDQAARLHRDISGQGFNYEDILQYAKALFDK